VKLFIVAVGLRQPAWANTAYADFSKRFPPDLRLELKAVKAEVRGSKTPEQLMACEAVRMQTALPKGVRRIMLDERGEPLNTLQVSRRILAWQNDGRDVAFLIGGPDGLDDGLKKTADETWRLSDLTLPHAFVRVLLAEALYRAWSLTVNHPYHRE
jgi:23S rRNA (pseudouridine1915-N3)-methyltransferase